MHDLISFSVSQITLLDTPREFRYVSDGRRSRMRGDAGRWNRSPTRRPDRDMYSIPTTMLWSLFVCAIFRKPIRWIWSRQAVMCDALRCTTASMWPGAGSPTLCWQWPDTDSCSAAATSATTLHTHGREYGESRFRCLSTRQTPCLVFWAYFSRSCRRHSTVPTDDRNQCTVE